MKALVQTILNATAAGKSMLLAANAAAQKTLLSLQNVDNTSDANKPVSTAQQTAIDAKLALAGGTMTGDLQFTDATYDIGKAGATRPRDGHFSRRVCVNTSDTTFAINVAGDLATSGAWRKYSSLGGTSQMYIDMAGNDMYFSNQLSGSIFFRTAATTRMTLSDSGLLLTVPVAVGVYTFATVPAAATYTGYLIRISDRAQKHAYSDGTNWRFFGDDAIIS